MINTRLDAVRSSAEQCSARLAFNSFRTHSAYTRTSFICVHSCLGAGTQKPSVPKRNSWPNNAALDDAIRPVKPRIQNIYHERRDATSASTKARSAGKRTVGERN